MNEVGLKDQCFGVEVELTGITILHHSPYSMKFLWREKT